MTISQNKKKGASKEVDISRQVRDIRTVGQLSELIAQLALAQDREELGKILESVGAVSYKELHPEIREMLAFAALFCYGMVDIPQAYFKITSRKPSLPKRRLIISFDFRSKDLSSMNYPNKLALSLYNFSQTDRPILLMGESGTGKSIYAKAIHFLSPLRDKPFLNIHCGSIPEFLLESELFGHQKGAFTGASADKQGMFEIADGGTIFLDEIGDASLSTQLKLLKVIEEKEFRRVGSVKTINVNVRIIAATNKDLNVAMRDGTFRPDLFYRLKGFLLRAPSLRERIKLSPDIIETFFALKVCDPNGKYISLSEEAKCALLRYNYPGNYRDLVNILAYAMSQDYDDSIDLVDLPEYISNAVSTQDDAGSAIESADLNELSYEDIKKIDEEYHKKNCGERKKIISLLRQCNGNMSMAARLAGKKKGAFRHRVVNYFRIDPRSI